MSDNNTNATSLDDKRYAIDIRAFYAFITLTMAASFIAGVALVPEETVIRTVSQQAPMPPHSVPGTFLRNKSDKVSKSIEEKHRPSGQHLMVDIRYVQAEFLNSEERLSKAMVDTVKIAGLTMLSYHCHALFPAGISCVGVLMESHISFHTWPAEGVITLDIFTFRNSPLLPVVETIEKLFGIPDGSDTPVRVQWSHELRGFLSEEEKQMNYLADSSDLVLFVLSPLEVHTKKQVYAGETKFQRVDIWDIIEGTDSPSYENVIKHNMTPDDPRLESREFTTPDRLLFLDGTLQSIRSSERIYHEALVHPPMFAHPGPRNLAILGGAEGATLREVLKHKTVESVTMIELDAELVALSRKFLKQFSDCSDIVGRAPCCFDDEKAKVEFSDGKAWFIDRFSPLATVSSEMRFDLVIVDALDPEDDTEIAGSLYSDRKFLDAMINSLSDQGVLAIQVGTAATIDDPRPDFGIYQNREILFHMLEENENVQAMLIYEEPNCGFLEPHSFLVVCKSADCRSRWYARSDQVNYQIYDRILPTISKERALIFYDGNTQRAYQWPKRGWETVYCSREPMPWECQFRMLDPEAKRFDFGVDEDDVDNFQVETRTDENGLTSSLVFVKKMIPKGSYIMPDHLASSLIVTSRNLQDIKENMFVDDTPVPEMEGLMDFFNEFSHPSGMEGSGQHYVEVGASVLIRRVNDTKLANVGPWVPTHPSGHRPKYSPVYERHRNSFDVFLVATRDIAAGEELLIYEDAWL